MDFQKDIFNSVTERFSEAFGKKDDMIIVRSPGRINLIGEHTDYNEGFVLPSAIDRSIYLVISPRNDSRCRLYAADMLDGYDFDVRKPEKSPKGWANYLIGVVDQLNKGRYDFHGFDCAFGGNIPIGAGMSSSAAIEAGLAFILNEVFQLGMERPEIARIAQKSENEFVGVRCGIMDQFANLLSKGKSVFRLDCRSLEYSYYPFMREDLKFVLCDTQVKRKLASSEYNVRRQQCEAGVKVVREHVPAVRSLRDVTFDMLNSYKNELDPIVYKRCHYVLDENQRVELACDCLEHGDYYRFGALLYESHKGLRDEYEVSCPELDMLVEHASEIDGVLGARMMGGGFGGCTLNLVQKEALNEFEEKISTEYLRKTGKKAEIYECDLVVGTDIVHD